MENTESNRRLAAILFTDIVGYTSMMQRDEKLAMTAVRRHHEILEQCVPAHYGKIQQYYGDGSLSIFNSATDAVHCAFEIQKEFLKEPVVPVRTGIHIGEIYSEGGKIFGDGVNLASRIESIGQGGTVLFSRDVYDKIRNHTEFEIRSIGSFEFKNVHEPIQVYALINTEIRSPDLKSIEGKLKEQSKKKFGATLLSGIGVALIALILLTLYLYPGDARTSDALHYKSSIAVLPFDNISNNPDEEFLSTGLAEDILTQLAQINGLKVIARTSSMKYKDYASEGRSLPDIAKELGVTNILAGTVRRYGKNLRVTVKLIDPKHENVLWAEEFDKQIEDVLNVQRDIAMAVSERLKFSLSPELQYRFKNKLNVNEEAYVNYQRGQEVLLRSSGSLEEIEQAKSYFEMAIQADSSFSRAWVGLADTYLEFVFWHRATDGEALPLATNAAKMALKIDKDLGEAYGALGAVELYKSNIQEAEKHLRKAIELSPSYAFAYERLAWIEFFLGRDEQGFALLENVIQLDPLFTRYKGSLGNAYYMTGNYEKGIQRLKEFLLVHPNDNFILWALAYLYVGNGEYQKAIETLDKRTIGRSTNWVYSYCHSKLGNPAAAQVVLDTLLARSKRGFVPDFMIAVAFESLAEHDSAIAHLDKAIHSGGESYFAWMIGRDPMFSGLRNDPRFKKLVKEVEEMYRD
jgi:TolB-like protein/class 3 adenylate cyclase/Flp pilus assembly protein TadD